MELRELLWSSAELETTQQTGQTKLHSFLFFDLYSSSSSSISFWLCSFHLLQNSQFTSSYAIFVFSLRSRRLHCESAGGCGQQCRVVPRVYYTMALNACSKIVIFNWSIANRIKSWYKYTNLNWSRRNEKNSGNVMFVVLCWKENEMFSTQSVCV